MEKIQKQMRGSVFWKKSLRQTTQVEEDPMNGDPIGTTDPEVARLTGLELARQVNQLRLIASENYVSRAVLAATGSVFTNKYSEGYPGRRYYQGQQNVDPLEELAMARAKALFGADHANVQPYSGSPANLAVYCAFMEPGDTLLGMALPSGGHLTHGWKVSITGQHFHAVQYEVNPETGLIDYDQIRDLAREHHPKVIVCGGTAYPRQIDFRTFREIANEVDAILHVDMSHFAGLVAGSAHPNPVSKADVVMTTTHKTLRGPRGAMILCKEDHKKAVNKAVFPGLQGGPHNHTTAAIAVALHEATQPAFDRYAGDVVSNARTLALALQDQGFKVITGGTDTHLILIDVTPLGTAGKPLAQALEKASIVVNCNTVPGDKRKPFDPSGIRLGTAAITSRGMKLEHMETIAGWIRDVADHLDDEAWLQSQAETVREFCGGFPCPGILEK